MSPEQHLAWPHSPLFRAIQKNIEVAGLIDDTVSNTPAMPLNDAHFGGFFMPEELSE